MTSTAALQPEPAPIIACTVSRDVQNFDLLIEDMEAELGEGWGDLSFEDAAAFFGQPEAQHLEFVAIAVDEEDEEQLPFIGELIKSAKENRIKVILIAEEVSPMALHQLLRLGADDFVPYPLPEGALHEAIERLQAPAPIPSHNALTEVPSTLKPTSDRDGVLLPVHGLAGGVGGTTFAVNLAWELATIDKKDPPRVCLLDLDLQFGSVSTFLDLPRRESVYELLAEAGTMDAESFMQALLPFNDKLHVLTAPADMLPLDFISPEDVTRLLEVARANFDFVVIDMPSTLVQWSETVLAEAHVYFAMLELDMRSAQNTLRLIRALKAEDLPFEKLRYALNRSPKFTDLNGKSRVKRMAESLDIDIEILLPDGGKQVTQAGDHGLPLADTAGKNPLRKEIRKLATSLYELNQAAETGE
ncbi:AAA family ATPase [Actibacterium ureilyticum]|uniref:AAA family ATPase n=1 Tax=Actibacterium ureilyticum TaxID=1590614 RepID=UPI000BAB1E45|nr:AAA family ATPase [Actibacterium ureilyticum]